MPRTRRVSVDVPEPLWTDVEARVARGEFASTSDAVSQLLLDDSIERQEETFVQELVRRLKSLPAGATDDDAVRLKREIYDRRHAELRAMLQVGIDEADRGDTTEFELDQFLAEARQRHAAAEPKRETA